MKVFKPIKVFLLLISLIGIQVKSQTVFISDKNNLNKPIKLAQHYGDQILLINTITTDNKGNCSFYSDSLSSGIYYLLFPDSTSFEFIFDYESPGDIYIQKNYGNNILMTAAPEASLEYNNYSIFIKEILRKTDSIKFLIRQYDLKEKEKRKLIKYREYLVSKKDSLISSISMEHKGMFLGVYFEAQTPISMPDFSSDDITVSDSAIWARQLVYYKKHYLDNIDLSDVRLINTPVYTSMINMYLDKKTPQKASEINKSIELILQKTKKSEDCFQFTLNYLLKKYSERKNNPVYEAVYVNYILNYYLEAPTKVTSNIDLNLLSEEYNSRKKLLLGETAPKIEMRDIDGNRSSLHDLKSKFTILYFFNYDCTICENITPEIKKLTFLNDTNYIKVFAVCMGDDEELCKNYFNKNGLYEWKAAIQTSEVNKTALNYNIQFTPTIYLLDDKKNIIDKNLTYRQLERIINKNK